MSAKLLAGDGDKRRLHDYYPTPEYATRQIVKRELRYYVDYEKEVEILEPACGEGHIVKVLRDFGFNKVAFSDINETSFLIEEKADSFDFLGEDYDGVEDDIVITNPPFSLFTEFVLRAKEIAQKKIIFLGKLNALAGLKRYKDLWTDKEFPLAKIYVFCYRVDFGFTTPPPLEHAWFVWKKHWDGQPKIEWISER